MEWLKSDTPVPYPAALERMEARARAIRAGEAAECVWLLEHPPLYTAGTSAKPQDLLRRDLPVFDAGRGGQYTYHGPGQRVAYAMLDLQRRGADLRRYVFMLEDWIIATLASLGVKGERREGRVGVWVGLAPYNRAGEAKIAAIGVRVRKWVTLHGISLNVSPDLSHYNGIVPCGIAEHGVTSLADLGVAAGVDDVDAALEATFPFAPARERAA